MKIKTLTAALACALPVTGAFAAALDRSGQSISAFLQPGNYAEISMSVLDPDVSGKTHSDYPSRSPAAQPFVGGQSVGEMADDYAFGSAAIKVQPTEHFSFGLLYDQPFGASASYSAETAALPNVAALGANAGQGAFHNGSEGTEVSFDTHSLSAIFGFQPNVNWNIYGGPVYQTIEGEVKLRGLAYGGPGLFGGYDAKIDQDGEFGWLAGVAFQIPDIALKASLTYRSEVEHESVVEESIGAGASPTINAIVAAAGPGITDITTPQSVNLDLQSGIMANTVAFANVRWVNWKDFSIKPHQFGAVADAVGAAVGAPNGFDLIAYSDDQWSVNAGVGRKLNDKWSGSVSVGWDSGAGNPVSTLGPTEGYINTGIGIQYSPAANYFVQGGVKYFWLGDAEAQTGSQFGTDDSVAEFEDNTAIAYGLKLGYRF
ncbi:outer membrane protein transport protein [Acinetobacter sp.]|uniref:outer membrane protein transport protein n=1 Tax=Acinetobacter sp. TaxID=472 RepID=UPI0035B1D412